VRELKAILFKVYGGFADKRIQNLDHGSVFTVDDRSGRDLGADKKLYGYFCLMFAEVLTDTDVSIRLRGNVPLSNSVKNWVAKHQATLDESATRVLTFSVRKGATAPLLELAEAISSIVAKGARYKEPSYKYVCPRTAESLRKLEKVLRQAWAS
jgi:hypothetical protein